MSLSTLRKTYGNGTRREVINRAIRAECPGGNQCLDAIAALNVRITTLVRLGESSAHLVERLKIRDAERSQMAAQIEAKHNVGPNTNRRRVTA